MTGLFTHKSVPVIFEPPCTFKHQLIIAAIFVFDDLFKLRSLKSYPNKKFEGISSYKKTHSAHYTICYANLRV